MLAPQVASDIIQISSTVDQIALSIPTVALQSNEEPSVVPPTIVSTSISSLITVPSPHRGVISVASVDAALMQPGHIWHPPGSLSSPQTTTYSNITTQVISASDANGTTSSGALSAGDNSSDLARPIAMDILRDENESVPSSPNIAERVKA